MQLAIVLHVAKSNPNIDCLLLLKLLGNNAKVKIDVDWIDGTTSELIFGYLLFINRS